VRLTYNSEAAETAPMWNLFSPRRNRARRPTPARTDAWSPVTNNAIATIDHIGPTAVATLTVTALATTEGVGLLLELFDDVSHSGARSLVLDVQNLEFVDSACLGCLVQALNNAIAQGGRIALVNTEGAVQELLRATRLDRLFPICHDVPAALTAIERAT